MMWAFLGTLKQFQYFMDILIELLPLKEFTSWLNRVLTKLNYHFKPTHHTPPFVWLWTMATEYLNVINVHIQVLIQ